MTEYEQTDIEELCRNLPPFCETFFKAKNDRFSDTTRINYARDLRIFFHYLLNSLPELFPHDSIKEIELNELEGLNYQHIDDYVIYLENYTLDGKVHTNGAPGKRRKIASIKTFFAYFCRRNMLKNNPTIYVELPQLAKKDIDVLTDREDDAIQQAILSGRRKSDRALKFHEHTKNRDYAIYMLLRGTGIRVSELTKLNDRDVNYEEQCINVHRKGGKQQVLYFNKEVLFALIDYIEEERTTLLKLSDADIKDEIPDGPLFVSNQGSRLTARRIQQIIKQTGANATSRFTSTTPHTIRRTFGTKIARKYGIQFAQEQLGHEDSATTTRHYAKMNLEELRQLRNDDSI